MDHPILPKRTTRDTRRPHREACLTIFIHLMTTTFATPHLRDLREVLTDTLKQTQEAIRRTRELLQGSDHLVDPDGEPEPASEPAQVGG